MQVKEKVGVTCRWTIKEKRDGIYVPVLVRENTLTTFGLSNLAAAWGGQSFVLPEYLVIDQSFGVFSSLPSPNPGGTSVILAARVDQAGDTQLILGAGLTSQETVTFTGVSGSGPYTYALVTGTAKTHLITDPVLRQVSENDTLATVVSEMAYDPTNDPGNRAVASAGYSSAVGNWTVQFYLTGTQGVGNLMTLGLSDTQAMGAGQIHNHCILGYYHAANVDIEVDASLTLANA